MKGKKLSETEKKTSEIKEEDGVLLVVLTSPHIQHGAALRSDSYLFLLLEIQSEM